MKNYNEKKYFHHKKIMILSIINFFRQKDISRMSNESQLQNVTKFNFFLQYH